MKFDYEYRTSDNVVHRDVISAANREKAFDVLKSQGIRPSRLAESPGVLNKGFGKGKRWIAIIVLASIAATTIVLQIQTERRMERTGRMQQLPRRQIPGIPNDWRERIVDFLPLELDRFFAHFAQPGVVDGNRGEWKFDADSFDRELRIVPEVNDGDPDWVQELKAMIVGMKREAQAMRTAGKVESEITMWLEERQRMESVYRVQVVKQFERGEISKADANAILSATGLKLLK